MIQITDRLWIGNSDDEQGAGDEPSPVDAVLNVAVDLQPTCSWSDGLDYHHVGLVDGPGNPPYLYCAAVLVLIALLKGNHHVLVCCHTMSRSLAIVAAYIHLAVNKPIDKVLSDLHDRHELPEVHPSHIQAYAKMNWDLLWEAVK